MIIKGNAWNWKRSLSTQDTSNTVVVHLVSLNPTGEHLDAVQNAAGLVVVKQQENSEQCVGRGSQTVV